MRRAEVLTGWLTLVLAELLVVATWWPVRQAEFGPIDDHGIVQML
jgi:hypothetical protein